jgi:hypothetical protein
MGQVVTVILGLTGPIIVAMVARYLTHWWAKWVWTRFADQEDLEFEPPGWNEDFEMAGEFYGEPVEARMIQGERAAMKRMRTVYEVELPEEAPDEMVLTDEGLFDKVGQMFGGQEIEVGRPELDDAFEIQGTPESEVRAYLDRDEVAEALLELYEFCETICLEEGKLRIERVGMTRDDDRIIRHLGALVECVERMRGRAEGRTIGEAEDRGIG